MTETRLPITGTTAGSFLAGGHGTPLILEPGQVVAGVVRGPADQGHILVTTAQGALLVPNDPKLVPGARVILTLEERPDGSFALLVRLTGAAATPFNPPSPVPSNAMLPPSGPTATGVTLFSEDPAASLGRIFETLRGFDPALVNTIQARLVLDAKEPWLPAMLRAASALMAGDLTSLLGPENALRLDATRAKAARQALARKLGELRQLAKPAADAPWRALFLPLADGDGLGALRLFVAHHGEAPETERDAAKPVRFLFEMELSALGTVQLDGLYGRRRLDLVLRSHRPLASDWRTDLRALYARAQRGLELEGALRFEVTSRFPVSPLATLRGAHSAVASV